MADVLAQEGWCLTLRSSGPPPAWHLAREALWSIVHLAGQVPFRRRPLSSNVRPHNPSLRHKGSLLEYCHWRVPLRESSVQCCWRTAARWRLPLPRLQEAPWCSLSRVGHLPSVSRIGHWFNRILRRAPLLPQLRVVGLFRHWRRTRSPSRFTGHAQPVQANLRALGRPARVLAPAVPRHEALRAGWRRLSPV